MYIYCTLPEAGHLICICKVNLTTPILRDTGSPGWKNSVSLANAQKYANDETRTNNSTIPGILIST